MNPYSLYDIEDVEAFVVMCIKRSGASPSSSEFEDLTAEGMLIIFKLSTKYRGSPDGDPRWCFSGYCLKYVPPTLRRVWHQMQENHIYKTMPDGKRRWIEYPKHRSYDAMIERVGEENGGLDETRIKRVHEFLAPTASKSYGI